MFYVFYISELIYSAPETHVVDIIIILIFQLKEQRYEEVT